MRQRTAASLRLALFAGALLVVVPPFSSVPRAFQGADIKVHGHWTIEVRNPDGRMAARHEFQNALTTEGAELIRDLLLGTRQIRLWQVNLIPVFGTPCPRSACSLIQNVTAGDPDFFPLTVEVPATGPNAGHLVFRGTAVAVLGDGRIGAVTTALAGFSTPAPFTARSLASPIDVVQGQSITVTVVFSFS